MEIQRTANAGVVVFDGNYYYVRSNGQLAVNREYYITRTNDLLPEGTYKFGVDGKMLLDRKITIENIDGVLYAYRDGEPYYLGLFELNGNYYYARSNRQLAVDCEYYISKSNGLLPEGTYTFDKEGRIVF